MAIIKAIYNDGKVDMVASYKGRVLAKREKNYPDDSDFYAIVWDDATNTFKMITYMTTRFGGTDDNEAVVDATETTMKKAARYLEKILVERWNFANELDAKRPEVGKDVEVTAGRKHKGKWGRVTWMGQSNFNRGESTARIDAGGGDTFFVPAWYLMARDWKSYLSDEKKGKAWAKNSNRTWIAYYAEALSASGMAVIG